MTDYDACLTDWVIARHHHGAIICGTIAGKDRKERFETGFAIATSYLKTPDEEIKEGEIVQTLNSRYLLGRRAAQPSGKQVLFGAFYGLEIDGGPQAFIA